MRKALLIGMLATLVATLPAAASPARGVAVVPFENLSGEDVASREITMMMMGALNALGWGVANPLAVEQLLDRERARYLDSLDDGPRARLLEETGMDAVVTGTVYAYSEGRNPSVAIAARMIAADGRLLWSDVAAVSTYDTEKLFGFGRKTLRQDVALEAVRELTASLGSGTDALRPATGRRPGLFRAEPSSVVSPSGAGEGSRLVCVLPFENLSAQAEASRIVADTLSLRLAAADGVRVVDASRLRHAAGAERIASFRTMTPGQLQRLAAAVGTTLVLRGIIYDFDDGLARGSDPRISVELMLEDVESGKVVWVAQHERCGSDYVGFLMRGAEVTGVGLTDRVVSEMVAVAREAFDAKPDDSASLGLRRRRELRGPQTAERKTQAGVTR